LSAASLSGAIAFGKLSVNVLNANGGPMSLVTTVTGFVRTREMTTRARILRQSH
jgi:nucleobase:cation symporter-1, NCS1 family